MSWLMMTAAPVARRWLARGRMAAGCARVHPGHNTARTPHARAGGARGPAASCQPAPDVDVGRSAGCILDPAVPPYRCTAEPQSRGAWSLWSLVSDALARSIDLALYLPLAGWLVPSRPTPETPARPRRHPPPPPPPPLIKQSISSPLPVPVHSSSSPSPSPFPLCSSTRSSLTAHIAHYHTHTHTTHSLTLPRRPAHFAPLRLSIPPPLARSHARTSP